MTLIITASSAMILIVAFFIVMLSVFLSVVMLSVVAPNHSGSFYASVSDKEKRLNNTDTYCLLVSCQI